MKGYLVGDCASKGGVWRKYMIFRTQFLSESPPSIYTQLTATHTPPTDIWEFFWVSGKKKRNPSHIKAKSHLTNVPLFPFRIRVNELIRQTFCTWEHAFSFLDLPGWVGFHLTSFPNWKKYLHKSAWLRSANCEKTTTAFILLSYQKYFLLIWLGYQQKVVQALMYSNIL